MKSRPPFESAYVYLLLVLVGFMIADLVIMNYRDRFLPTKAPPYRARPIVRAMRESYDYSVLLRKNLFNSDGKIAEPVGASEKEKIDEAPIPSNLPLALVGTIVHVNAARSVASLNVRNKNEVISFVNGENVEGMATIEKIERGKVTFRNSATGRLEYIEMKSEGKFKLGVSKGVQNGEVLQESDNAFRIKKSDITRLTSDLPNLLQQARAVPNIVPGSGGQVDGFRVLDIMPGSIFEKLGIKRMDVIKSVNGEPVNSPNKAMELYNALRESSSQINLGIERNGRLENFNYTVE